MKRPLRGCSAALRPGESVRLEDDGVVGLYVQTIALGVLLRSPSPATWRGSVADVLVGSEVPFDPGSEARVRRKAAFGGAAGSAAHTASREASKGTPRASA